MPEDKKNNRSHPWRICPEGEHWVRTHDMNVPVSEKNPDGVRIRHGHCAHNPSRKDQIKSDELREIAKGYFSKLKGPPKADNLHFKNGNKYDEFIRGWTQFWNETLKPKDPLDPNLLKALIATESGFDENPNAVNTGTAGQAHGLMQVTDQAREALGNLKGELKDHFVEIEKKEILDPNLNIAAGTRWLFHKQRLASSKLKRPATWEEGVEEYKDIRGKKDPTSNRIRKDLAQYYKQLQSK